jgi:hypothetical protein
LIITADKAGVFSLFGTRYQVGRGHARRKLQVRFDPEALHEVEVWRSDKFLERARPLQVGPHRRPLVTPAPQAQVPTTSCPKSDWPGHLVHEHRAQSAMQSPAHLTDRQRRSLEDEAVIALLAKRLDPCAFDEVAARDWLARFGPLDPARAITALASILARGIAPDQHVYVTLDLLRTYLRSPTP